MKPIEQVIADAREEAAVLRKHGQAAIATAIDRVCDEVSEATEDYRTWLTETDAMLRSGHTRTWLRNRFPAWAHQGMARWSPKNSTAREFRALIIPVRTNLAALRADARMAARGDERQSA